MRLSVSVIFLLIACAYAHVQYVEKEAIAGRLYTLQNGDDLSFDYPFDLNAADTLQAGVNPMEDARFISAYLSEDDVDVVKFQIAEGTTSTANAVAWTPACEEGKNIYVNTALLGPLTDSRFKKLSKDDADEFGINWRKQIPEGYGVILGINAPVNKKQGQERPTLLITIPVGEIPNRWFLPYNSGELDPECNAFRRYINDNSTGKGGCLFPTQRCPGAPYPYNQTNPYCPHYKVGNFCGPKPWRWINEVDLNPGTYYVVYWETNGKATDVGYFMGWNEDLRYGTYTNRPECLTANAPSDCRCGSKGTFSLPPGCTANFPAARERTKIIYSELTGQAVWHRKCDAAPEAPYP